MTIVSGRPDRHSLLPNGLNPSASVERDRLLSAMEGHRPICEHCTHRHSIHSRCSIHAFNCPVRLCIEPGDPLVGLVPVHPAQRWDGGVDHG